MIRHALVLFVLCVCSTTAARAEWVFRTPAASDDLGSALVRNPSGILLDVGCGNGGLVSISLTPDPRPRDLAWIGDGAVLWFRVDGGPQLQMPATCSASGCYQDFMLGGEPWPVSQMQAITRALRAGSMAEVLLNGRVIQRFALAGSSAALGALARRTGCEGL